MHSAIDSYLRGVFCLFILVVSSCGVNSYERSLQEGIQKYTAGNYEQAERSFSLSVAWAEKHGSHLQLVTSLGYLGRTLDSLRKTVEAEDVFKRRISIAETNKLDDETRLETFLAAGIFYSRNRECGKGRRLLLALESSKGSFRSEDSYVQTVDDISGLLKLHCSKEP